MKPIRSRKVLDSARGQPCSARFPWICNGDPATTVFAHLNGAAFGKGMSQKAHDVLGFHACFACHTYFDVGHGTKPILSNDALLECVLSAVCETWVRLIVAGVVIVPLDPERHGHDKPTPPRKPPEQRRAIPKGKPMESHSAWPAKGTRPLRSRNMKERGI